VTGKRVLVGVTGGIAAYKAVTLVRALQKEGAEVRVVLTPSATKFVGIETFLAITRHEVAVDVFNSDNPDIQESWSKHIHWAEWADAMVIAPCTANSLAKLVHGLSDNMLTTMVMAARCPVLICPTMDGGMYRSPSVTKNISEARAMGFHVLEPDTGYLASGLEDTGRLPEPEAILSALDAILTRDLPLKGKRVVVTAGPTREHIDAVRFISNPSTGKMGVAMAEAAKALGADVTLIHGPLSVAVPAGMTSIGIVSASDLFEAVKANLSACDIIVMSAAVSDFTPETQVAHKIKKSDAATTLVLKPTTDILSWIGAHKATHQTVIGFAMETENLIPEARRKRREKNADWILANSLSDDGSGFAGDTNTLYAVGKDESAEPVVLQGSKKSVALEALRLVICRIVV
jgi:phosphopantothenoylcysteine decarboxylase/phosphopantothenate--cysteine ligase